VSAVRPSATTRLLTRHFLRRFFENDLISPHVDLHENSAVAVAGIVSLSLFASVMLGGKYLMGASPPGVVTIESLGDNFFFLSISMLAMALMAALQWDALSLDTRDTANLGPLPIPRRTLVVAKLSALVIFACGFAVALNLFPSFVHQIATTTRMPVGLPGALRLVFAHAVASLFASAFGFLTIVALRELLRAWLGQWFGRVSMLVQGVLVLACMSALLVVPVSAYGWTRSWMRDGLPSPWQVPPLWFFGLEQSIAGGVIPNSTGFVVAARMSEVNDRWLASYQAREALFPELATIGIVATVVMLVIAAATYGWNLRQLPQPTPSSQRRRSLVATLSMIAAGGDSVRRAGFGFALRALLRSAPHRLSMAAALALAIALSLGLLGRADFQPAIEPDVLPRSILAVQTVVMTLLLAGFRRAVRVPAELNANWMIQLSWRDAESRFLSGVKRAALVGIAWPTAFLLLPLHLWLLSERTAIAHLLIGFAYGAVVVEVLFARCDKVPFASAYEPLSHVKTIGPILFVFFLMFVHAFATIERFAIRTNSGVMNFVIALVVVLAATRIFEHWSRRASQPMKFDEPPEPSTQWLSLSG
jgi:hypothetical protein